MMNSVPMFPYVSNLYLGIDPSDQAGYLATKLPS